MNVLYHPDTRAREKIAACPVRCNLNAIIACMIDIPTRNRVNDCGARRLPAVRCCRGFVLHARGRTSIQSLLVRRPAHKPA